MRPQWLVRPPTMRARHQLNSVPAALVYGSPSISQPPMQASNSPNGRSLVDLPRRGDAYGQVSMAESLALSHGTPASSTITSAPAWVSAWAAMPPQAPEPTMHTSYCFACPTNVMCVPAFQTVQTATASESEVSGSRVGVNSCATKPWNPVSAMAAATACQFSSCVPSSSWRPG